MCEHMKQWVTARNGMTAFLIGGLGGEYYYERGERYGEILVGCQVVSVGGVGCLVVVVDVVVVVLVGWGMAWEL